jgi:dTDP-4-amino-4,6-dideoxygalactose transaminase
MSSPVTSVPLLDLRAQYLPIREAVLDAITRVCDSQRFIMGPEVEGLERELAAMLEVRDAVGVSSGTDALLAAMMALNIGPGDEVVTSTYSFFATAGCVARLGAKPVLVDIDPVTYNIDPAAMAAAMTPRTKAVIPVHLYGCSAEMTPILETAARAEPKYFHTIVGANFRLDAIQAAVLRVKLPHLAAWTEARRRNAARYREMLAPLVVRGQAVLPVEPEGAYHIYNQFVIRLADRDRVKAALDAARVASEIYYPVPFHLQPCFADLGYSRGDFPHAERAAEQTIAIPIYSELSIEQQRTVVAAIADFIAGLGADTDGPAR